MDESILNTIKKLIGLEVDYTQFDTDVITHINTALGILFQLGIGPEDGLYITSAKEKWMDLLDGENLFELVKTYVYLFVRNVFDPPSSSSVLEANRKLMDQLEWRIVVMADHVENQ